MVKASIIIPTHNRAHILELCLTYLLNQTIKDYEVIIVDDASQDETPELIAKYKIQNTNFKYIRLKNQSGPYVARNIGIEKAQGEVIIFIDSDVIVHPKFVEDHISIHEKNKKAFVQGMVKHIRREVRPQEDQVNFKFYFPNALCIRTFITQNASVRKEWLERVGGFAQFGPFMGFKDIDLGLRLRKMGLHEVYTFKKCKAYHVDGPLKKENLKEFFHKHLERGKSAYFFVKEHGKLGEKYAHIKKALFISNFLQTERWVDKAIKSLESLRDSPILPLFPICKGIIKYHYRAMGIKEAISQQSTVDSQESLTSTNNQTSRNKIQTITDNQSPNCLPCFHTEQGLGIGI